MFRIKYNPCADLFKKLRNVGHCLHPRLTIRGNEEMQAKGRYARVLASVVPEAFVGYPFAGHVFNGEAPPAADGTSPPRAGPLHPRGVTGWYRAVRRATTP